MRGFSTTKESLEFLKNNFKKYYRDNEVELPDRFARREYGFIFFGGKGMMRHLSFDRKKIILKFLKDKSPAHVYYSSAFYKTPNAQTMNDKGWMGAELIFDLDSDHLPNSEKMSYVESLQEVKKEFYKLVEEFLLGDFGFDEKYLDLYFSGGRGYHCHVMDPRVFSLGSNERREIVDYITGRNLDEHSIFHEYVTTKKTYGTRSYPYGKSLKMPKPDEPGWRGRISQGIIEIVNEIKMSEKPIEKLCEYGVKKNEAKKLIEELSDERVRRIYNGELDQSRLIRKFFLNSALRRTAVAMSAGETDEPVTCDVKRLIRLPGSLHGKTGFKVTKVDLDDLKNFDPLHDAIVFPGDSVNVDVQKPFDLTINDEDFNLDLGENEVPRYLAVFLVGMKIANII